MVIGLISAVWTRPQIRKNGSLADRVFVDTCNYSLAADKPRLHAVINAGGIVLILKPGTTVSDMASHMSNSFMCDAFLRIAKTQYPDLLASVPSDAARAISSWLVLYGYRPSVHWSDEDDCFIGCLRNAGSDFVSFHGKTATGLQQAFEKAVREYMVTRAGERHSSARNQVLSPTHNGEPTIFQQSGPV